MANEEFNREVDNIIENFQTKKKRKNSKAKGNRGESLICKILSDRFGGKSFERVMGSGNRWGQVKHLPDHAKTTLLGDICPPEGFVWVIEVKIGYEDSIDFYNLFKNGNKQIDDFIDQSHKESERANRPPLIFYKRDRKPWLAIIEKKNLVGEYEFSLNYKDWVIVSLDDLLKLPESFFFKEGFY